MHFTTVLGICAVDHHNSSSRPPSSVPGDGNRSLVVLDTDAIDLELSHPSVVHVRRAASVRDDAVRLTVTVQPNSWVSGVCVWSGECWGIWAGGGVGVENMDAYYLGGGGGGQG